MFSEIKIFTAAFVIFVAMMIVVGAALGENFADTDVFNQLTNGAEADQTRSDTTWQSELRALEKPLLAEGLAADYENLKAQREAVATLIALQAELDARQMEEDAQNRIDQQKEDMRLDALEREQKLRNKEQLVEALILILKVFGIAMAVAVGGCVMVVGVRRFLLNQTAAQAAPAPEIHTRPFAQTWEKTDYRQDRIRQARRMEQDIRRLQLAGKQPDSSRREIYPWRT